MIWSSPLLAFASMAISFLVTHQVIALASAPRSSRPALPASASRSAQAPTQDWYDLRHAGTPPRT
jgi:hypothetical protein